jgi:hypothetical protein
MSSSPRGKTLLDTMLLTLSAAALPLSWFLLRKSGRRGALAVVVGDALVPEVPELVVSTVGVAVGRTYLAFSCLLAHWDPITTVPAQPIAAE